MNHLHRSFSVVFLLSAAIFFEGCAGCRKWSLDGTNETDSSWVVGPRPTSRVAVVFVHGIFGDTIGTWTNASGARFFDLLDTVPGIAGKTDMLAFGFPSSMFATGSFDIREAANRLHLRLSFHGVLNYQRIVFVAHSMGGLVVLRELLTHSEIRDRVPVIVFLATPQEGAQIALIASHVLNNPALSQMRPSDANDLLKTLSDEWSSIPSIKRPPIRCAYEGLDTYGVRIVPWSSATRFCSEAPPPIKANHINISKPARADDDAVAVVATALHDYVFSSALEPKLETPDFRQEGDHFVIDLTSVAPPQRARLLNTGGSRLRYTLAEISDPRLYLWPQDTPKDLPANGREDMQIGLGIGATATEYRFILRTDVESDRHVTVRVPNLAALAAQEANLAQGVASALESLLSSSTDRANMSAAAAESTEVLDLVTRTVREAVARNSPVLPESGQWLIAADFLNAMNWPTLAAHALRQAERTSPASVLSPSAQRLAAITGYLSGESQVFEMATTPILSPAEVARLADHSKNILVDTIGSQRAASLASGLKVVPALKVYGYSLQGDVQNAEGNVAEARRSLEAAAKIRATPSVTHRLRQGSAPKINNN